MKGDVSSYCNMICHVWLTTPCDLSFSGENRRRIGFREIGGGEEGLGGEEGKEFLVRM